MDNLPKSRVIYCLLFVLEFVALWVCRELLAVKYYWLFSRDTDCTDTACYKHVVIYKLSFSYSMFHLLLALLFLPHRTFNFSTEPYTWQHIIQYNLWLFKLALFVVLHVITYFIPAGFFFKIYPYISISGGGIFLFLQAVLITDLAYTWHESWASPSGSKWSTKLIITTIIFYTLSFALCAALVYFFVDISTSKSCTYNLVIITETVIVCFLFSLTSAHDKIERGSLFTSSILTLDSFLLILSALSESKDCNPLDDSQIRNVTMMLLAAIFAVVAVSYSSLHYFVAARSINQQRIVLTVGPPRSDLLIHQHRAKAARGHGHPHRYGTIQQDTIFPDQDDLITYNPANEKKDSFISTFRRKLDYSKKPYNFSKFHLVFFFGGMYLGMSVAFRNYDDIFEVQRIVVFWITVAVQTVTALLYIWSLIAPLFIKNLQMPLVDHREVVVEGMPDQSQ